MKNLNGFGTLKYYIVMIATILLLNACGEDKSNIKMYVNAARGLIIRADSNTKASKLGIIPYGKQVSVLEQSDKAMTVSGKTGHWTKVEYNGIVGWSFGGFLSATPPGPLKTTSNTKCQQFNSCHAKCVANHPGGATPPELDCSYECSGQVYGDEEYWENNNIDCK